LTIMFMMIHNRKIIAISDNLEAQSYKKLLKNF